MKARALFRCDSLEKVSDEDVDVTLSAVTDGSDEAQTFSRYTPAGDLKMSISNPTLLDFFRVGKEYYLDFTPKEG